MRITKQFMYGSFVHYRILTYSLPVSSLKIVHVKSDNTLGTIHKLLLEHHLHETLLDNFYGFTYSLFPCLFTFPYLLLSGNISKTAFVLLCMHDNMHLDMHCEKGCCMYVYVHISYMNSVLSPRCLIL